MISRKFTLLLLAFLPLFFWSCSSDDDGSGSGPNFIEFKLNDRQVRINDYGTGQGVISATLLNLQDISAYTLVSSYTRVWGNENIGVHFSISSKEPLGIRTYPVDGSTVEGLLNYPTYSFVEVGKNTMAARSEYTTGTIELTSFEAVIGGVVEGTFHFDNIVEVSETFDVISSNHTISEGRFRLTIDRIE
ncbi:MAG: hypothetical protein EA409_04070 [Saprospirales bacterium]|nr:MAG: hypothetical protein EA409_04070 [Saprospirales bacterium]